MQGICECNTVPGKLYTVWQTVRICTHEWRWDPCQKVLSFLHGEQSGRSKATSERAVDPLCSATRCVHFRGDAGTGSATCSCRTACASVLASFRRAMERLGIGSAAGSKGGGARRSGDREKEGGEECVRENNKWSGILFSCNMQPSRNRLFCLSACLRFRQARDEFSHFLRLARHEASPEARCRCRPGRSYLAGGPFTCMPAHNSGESFSSDDIREDRSAT